MIPEFLLAAVTVLALDQASKALVVRSLAEGKIVPVWPRSPIRFRRVANARPGLGLIQDRRALVAWWGCAAAGTMFVAGLALFDNALAHVGFGAAVGGATGNLLDRLRGANVVDFIDLRIWPVLNVADAAIVVGCAVALWSAQGAR